MWIIKASSLSTGTAAYSLWLMTLFATYVDEILKMSVSQNIILLAYKNEKSNCVRIYYKCERSLE